MNNDQRDAVYNVILFLQTHAIPGTAQITNKDAYLMSEFLLNVFEDGMTFEEAREASLKLAKKLV